MDPLKPGYKTSEGQYTLLVTLVNTGLTFAVSQGWVHISDTNDLANIIVNYVIALSAFISTTVVTIEYVKGRIDLKKAYLNNAFEDVENPEGIIG